MKVFNKTQFEDVTVWKSPKLFYSLLLLKLKKAKFDKLIFMKSKDEIKAELYKKIDSIDDEHTLNLLNDDIVPYAIENRAKDKDEEVDLTDEQWEELKVAIKQVKDGKTISLDEFYSKKQRWHTK